MERETDDGLEAIKIVQIIIHKINHLVDGVINLTENQRVENKGQAEFISVKLTSLMNGLKVPRVLPKFGQLLTLRELMDRAETRWEPMDFLDYLLPPPSVKAAAEAGWTDRRRAANLSVGRAALLLNEQPLD